MKKIFTLLTLALLSLSVSAQITEKKWDFTALTDDDLTALKENPFFKDETKNNRISNTNEVASNTYFALEASDGTDIAVAEGLTFGRVGNSISAGSFRYSYKENDLFIYFNNSNCAVKLPSIKGGQEVVIKSKSYNGSLTLTNGGSVTSVAGEQKFVVTADGAVTIQFNSKMADLQSIEVRTKVTDTTAPVLLSSVPANEAANVLNTTTSITLTFDDALTASSTIAATLTNPDASETNLTNGVASGNTLTFSGLDLTAVGNYTLTVAAGAFQNEAGINNTEINVSFTIIAPVTVLDVTEATTVLLTKANIEANAYLATNSSVTWATNKTYGGISGDFPNLGGDGRTVSVTVKGAKFFEVFVQNTTSGRTYKIQEGEGTATIITHGGNTVESSGLFSCSSSETTINIVGTDESVYPVKIAFYTERPTQAITVSAAGYATYSTNVPLDFTGSGASAYIITTTDGETATLEPITIVPANMGIIVKGNTAYNVPIALVTDEADATTGNKLVANVTSSSVAASAGTTHNYIFAKHGSEIGFYELDAAHNLAANKAYLQLTGVAAAPARLIIGGGEDGTTGIEAIAVEAENAPIYNLAGQRVTAPTKGIYIKGGKKYVIK